MLDFRLNLTGRIRGRITWFTVSPTLPECSTYLKAEQPALISAEKPSADSGDITGKVHKDEFAIGGGSNADVFMGTWKNGTTSTQVAIKVLRPQIYGPQDASTLSNALRKVMQIWAKLDHPNIVLLHGIEPNLGNCPAMVCQWMNQGTLFEYLDKEKENLDLPARLNICVAIARGLSYLHSQGIIHGDLSPANVLMNNNIAHLNNFGLSNVIGGLQRFFTSQSGAEGRWVAPELLQATNRDGIEVAPEVTMSSDVYSFASIAFYVTTGVLPYAHLRNNNMVIMEIVKKIQAGLETAPSRPANSFLMDKLWDILTKCWALKPAERPRISDVERLLRQL